MPTLSSFQFYGTSVTCPLKLKSLDSQCTGERERAWYSVTIQRPSTCNFLFLPKARLSVAFGTDVGSKLSWKRKWIPRPRQILNNVKNVGMN